jgi:hypothetical protein
MLELPVAPFLGHLNPAVVRQQPHDIPNFHLTITPLLLVGSWVIRGGSNYLAMQLSLFTQVASLEIELVGTIRVLCRPYLRNL